MRVLSVVVMLALLPTPIYAQGQQSVSLQSETIQTRSLTAPTKTAKTELANRFQDIKTQYASIKTATAKFVPLTPDAPPELRLTRSKISAAIYSYNLYEAQTQKQRDKLNLLADLSEAESIRLQMAMDRLAKMGGTIRGLIKQINESGDALVQNAR